MKRLLIVLVVVAAAGLGLGFYQRWFQVETDSSGNTRSVTFTLDADKVKKDKEAALDKVHDVGRPAKAADKDQPAPDTRPPPS
jgi:hypothetical protein